MYPGQTFVFLFYKVVNKGHRISIDFGPNMKVAFGLSFHYCKFGNFRENFIFANSVKTHIFNIEIGDKFAYAKFRENKTLTKISAFTVFENMDYTGFTLSCDSVIP